MTVSITTIQSTDLITNSRTDLNNNFSNLNNGKLDSSMLSTDDTFSGASDSKIPSQLAVRNYVDSGGNQNASTTQRGIVQEATAAEVAAKTATGTTGARLYVNPSTLIGAGYFGDGSDGDVTISTPTTLTRNMYYDNLIVNNTLTTDGYKIFVKNTISGNGTIDWGVANNGGNGSNGAYNTSSASGGTAGAQTGSGILKNIAGQVGGSGGAGAGAGSNGSNGVAGTSGRIGSVGVAGGRGGDTTTPFLGGTVGAAGADISILKYGIERFLTVSIFDYVTDGTLIIRRPIGSGSGSGGGSHYSSAGGGGGGGGSGATGGVVFIAALNFTGTFTIKAVGGNGGNGGNGYAGGAAVGGGGSGGAGGTSIVIYGTKTWSGSYILTGGIKGTKGSSGSSTNATDGNNGLTGTYYELSISNLI